MQDAGAPSGWDGNRSVEPYTYIVDSIVVYLIACLQDLQEILQFHPQSLISPRINGKSAALVTKIYKLLFFIWIPIPYEGILVLADYWLFSHKWLILLLSG